MTADPAPERPAPEPLHPQVTAADLAYVEPPPPPWDDSYEKHSDHFPNFRTD